MSKVRDTVCALLLWGFIGMASLGTLAGIIKGFADAARRLERSPLATYSMHDLWLLVNVYRKRHEGEYPPDLATALAAFDDEDSRWILREGGDRIYYAPPRGVVPGTEPVVWAVRPECLWMSVAYTDAVAMTAYVDEREAISAGLEARLGRAALLEERRHDLCNAIRLYAINNEGARPESLRRLGEAGYLSDWFVHGCELDGVCYGRPDQHDPDEIAFFLWPPQRDSTPVLFADKEVAWAKVRDGAVINPRNSQPVPVALKEDGGSEAGTPQSRRDE
jgi:hypothetical protein